VVELGRVQPARTHGIDDVRADDGRLVDLHRLAGIIQGTFETFAAAANKHFNGTLAGKLVVSGGMGGMGGAQPLAATMNDAVFLGIDVDRAHRTPRRNDYCDRLALDLDDALRICEDAIESGAPSPSGLSATARKSCRNSSGAACRLMSSQIKQARTIP
jgi:hypothetical protein